MLVCNVKRAHMQYIDILAICQISSIESLLTHWADPFLRRSHICSYSRISQHYIEPEGSLLCSQEPSTGPYPEPDQLNPYHPIPLRSILILPSHLCLGLPSGLFLLAFPPISYMHSSYPHVRWVPYHHGMVRPQVVDGWDALQVRKLRIYWISSRGQSRRGGPPAWGLGMRLTTPHRKK
jgi:hypothetical protein